VYFITGCCHEHFNAFESEEAKAVFWDRLLVYCEKCGFVLWVVSLMSNHYHIVGYNRRASDLKVFMQRFHGSVAKLVNDLLPERRTDFWRDQKGREYFDGCLRDEKQCRAACRYTRMQARRHGVIFNFEEYPHTRIFLDFEKCIRRANELGAFLDGVPYKRYEN